MKSKANDRQVGGTHYKAHKVNGIDIEHWDLCAIFDLDYFQGNITKYVMRHKVKDGLAALKKAAHVLEKYIEVIEHGYTPEQTLAVIMALENMVPPMPQGAHCTTNAFSFEGYKERRVLYRCRDERCREHFWIDETMRPEAVHVCKAPTTEDLTKALDARLASYGPLGKPGEDTATAHAQPWPVTHIDELPSDDDGEGATRAYVDQARDK